MAELNFSNRPRQGPLAQVDPVVIDQIIVAAECLEMRRQGYSYAQISERTGLKSPQIAQIIQQSLQNMLEADGEDVKRLELQRLDEIFKNAYARATTGNFSLAAVDACMRIMERRAKLLGLDAPVRTINEHNLNLLSDDELDAKLAQLSGDIIDVPSTMVRSVPEREAGAAQGAGGEAAEEG